MIGPVSDKFLLPTTTQIWWIWFIYRVVIGGLESSDRDKFSIYKDLDFFVLVAPFFINLIVFLSFKAAILLP